MSDEIFNKNNLDEESRESEYKKPLIKKISNKLNNIFFEPDTLWDSIKEILIFSGVQYYNALIFTLGYSFNLYYLSITYQDQRINGNMVKAIGMCNMFFNTLVIAVLRGVTSGWDILAANYIGAQEFQMFWQSFFSAAIVTTCISSFITIITLLFGLNIISFFFVVDLDTGILIKEYLFYLSLAIPLLSISFLITKMAAITKRNKQYSILLTINLLTEIFSSYYFINKLKYGVSGASLALFTSRVILLLTSIFYYFFIDIFRIDYCYVDFHKLYDDCIFYIKFTSSNFITLIISSFQLEISSIVAFYSSDLDYISFLIFSTISSYFSNITSAMGSSLVAFCGNNMTNNRLDQYLKHSKLIFILNLMITFILLIMLEFNQSFIYSKLINNESVIQYMHSVFYIFFLWQLSNSVFVYFTYLFRTLHLQREFMIISLVNYYGIQLSTTIFLSIILAWKIKGIYIGMLFGNFISIIVSFREVYYTDLYLVQQIIISKSKKV